MMQVLAFDKKLEYLEAIKYLRPVSTGSSRCADMRQSSLTRTNISSTSFDGNHLISTQSISLA